MRLLATAGLLCATATGAAPAAASTITGASLATCEPGPCLLAAGVETVELANVSNDDGTASTRTYAIERPQHLIGPAPAVLVFYGSGECDVSSSTRFRQLSAANRFVVVYMAVPCGRDNNWDKRNVDSTTTTTPDDEPYVDAVVADITRCPGACADPQRIYAAGMSSGGNMVADIMCDPHNSPLIRGYMIDSSSLPLFNGEPHCPSTNRSFFAMLALSNLGLDAGLYYDTDPNSPHLDVPAFADWAGRKLGCSSGPVLGSLGSPSASTLTYTYDGPCAYVSPGSPAVISLGVQNGAHGWGCQDSDPLATPFLCPTLPNPPGLDPNGLPQTNGLFVEEQFWNFVAQGESSSEAAPPAGEEPPAEEPPVSTPPAGVPPGGGGSPLPSAAGVGAHIANTPVGEAPQAWIALGDQYAAGTGDPPYLTGDPQADRCRRSKTPFPSIAAGRLGIAPSTVSVHACFGSGVPQFFSATGRDREPSQLSWVSSDSDVITLAVGWNDASMPAAIERCGRAPTRCRAVWGRAFGAALGVLGASSRHPRSLRHLYEAIASKAPVAVVVALGYPQPFPAHPPSSCRIDSGRLTFTRAAMRWVDREVARLDSTIRDAADAAHITYISGSHGAFAGHELCTRRPYLSESFNPNRLGQTALATLLLRALE